MTVLGLRGPIEWPGADPPPDLRHRPLLAAVAALHATARAVILALLASPRKPADPRGIAADNVVICAEQLLIALDRYVAAETAPAVMPPSASPRRRGQLALPFPTATKRARAPARERAR